MITKRLCVGLAFAVLNLGFAHPTPEVKVALLGDTGAGANFASVLELVQEERADVVMINGDFGYGALPSKWANLVKSSIDISKFPIIGALGNHDVERKEDIYIPIFESFRNETNGLKTKCTGQGTLSRTQDTIAVNETCTFGNVTIVASAIGQVFTKPFFEGQLEEKLKTAPASNWKLVGYHFTLQSMNPGVKGDQNTFEFFDVIRRYGAIGAQAHTHTASASCPISSRFAPGASILCHDDFGANLEQRFVMPGTSVYLDSSLGGIDARPRKTCAQASDPKCQHLVDIICKRGYTRSDGTRNSSFTRYGAMFVIFNHGGDTNKALVYFKSVDRQTIFKFEIEKRT